MQHLITKLERKTKTSFNVYTGKMRPINIKLAKQKATKQKNQ